MSAPSVDTRLVRQAFGGVGLIALVVLVAGFLPGRPQALTVTITIITFGLPFLIAMTLWWNGWPVSKLPRGVAGVAGFALLVVLALVFSVIGQAVTGEVDLAGMFGAADGFPLFPYGFVLAASIFVTTLQFTFVAGKMPFHRLPPVAGGFAMLVTVWAAGLLQYFLLVNWDGPGAPPPPHAGSGPVYALDWPAVLLSMVVLQLIFFVLLRGRWFDRITDGLARFLVADAFTIVGGIVLYRGAVWAGFTGNEISAGAGCIAASVILIEILFGGWPFGVLDTARQTWGKALYSLALAAVLFVLLRFIGGIGYPADDSLPPVELWIAGVGLNLIAAFAIIHVSVFDRWPLPPLSDTEGEDAAPVKTEDLQATSPSPRVVPGVAPR